MTAVRSVYRVIRSILFAAVLTVAGIFILSYLILSIPWTQKQIKATAEKELSVFFKAPVEIGSLDIRPFNEVRLSDVAFRTPSGQKCIVIDRLGAGIAIWKLITTGRIEVTYAELMGMKAKIEQPTENAPLNIQFIIDAFKPKKPGNPPAKFDIKLHNVVIRKSVLSFDRMWKPRKDTPGLDINHLNVYNLRADVAMPKLKNDDFEIDLRRLSFKEKSGLYVDALSLYALISPERIGVRNFRLKLNNTDLTINDITLAIKGYKSIPDILKNTDHSIFIKCKDIDPADFMFLDQKIATIPGVYNLVARIDGNLDRIVVNNLDLISADKAFAFDFKGEIDGAKDIGHADFFVRKLNLKVPSALTTAVLNVIDRIPDNVREIVSNVGDIYTDLHGVASLKKGKAMAIGTVETSHGNLNIDGTANWRGQRLAGNLKASTEGFKLSGILAKQPVDFFIADIEADMIADGKRIEGLQGNVSLNVPCLDINGYRLENILINADKNQSLVNADLSIDCQVSKGSLNGQYEMNGADSHLELHAIADYINTAVLPGVMDNYPCIFSAQTIDIDANGNNPDNLTGHVNVVGFNCDPMHGSPWSVDNLLASVENTDGLRHISLFSDPVDAVITGHFKYTDIVPVATDILSNVIPAYIKAHLHPVDSQCDIAYDITVKPDKKLYEAFKAPLLPLKPVHINGKMADGVMTLDADAPYLIKGEKKLIKDTRIALNANRDEGVTLNGKSKIPVKNGYTNADIGVTAFQNKAYLSLNWTFDNNNDLGHINIGCTIDKPDNQSPSFIFDIKDSDLVLNGAKWEVSPAHAMFSDKVLSINNLKVAHGGQYVNIDGKASGTASDTITARLSDIDLSYIFNTLNINYVTFGGFASGEAIVTNLFTKEPIAHTNGLRIKGMSYNGAVLGDADISGAWDNTLKSVAIGADITDGPDSWAKVNGNVFVTRDSLGFHFLTHKINIGLIKPFLDNVLGSVSGKGTADLTLFGTFKDITMTGKAFADTAAVKIAYTNVTYTGSDSVLFYKDRIVIPGFTVYDRYGRHGRFSGEVRHNYFHDAHVEFNIRDVDNLLCYDTDAKLSPFWYGRIFASGTGRVFGYPGYTMINFNVTTCPNSNFTFVLDENQTASEYNFLTFTDSHKKYVEMSGDELFEEQYRSTNNSSDDDSGMFELDLGVGVTPGIKMNVIMDPSAGDKITAIGSGAMRLHYDTQSDNIDMFGRYTLDEGNYRFSFEDIILRDFKIRSGSSISFNGDPLKGILDITAGYRVNTNLTDLDKSFATDRDLNRSSVPVEALLKVSGDLGAPDIAFDISLPTVTSEVERKVRSIVSSEEMLNQQVLYLLALNRFYTPQFSGSSDGELVSVASSTLSSQLSNVLSQITDKVTLNPSFKSDRSDFSDMEVDLALSSQLFDNRLIINGNLGYRDRSVSQTNFIGDFDIEYLLSKDGKLRLKAYNHFNDAYYYLKSALTTQGIGLIYRKDFDDAFSFLKRKRKKKTSDSHNSKSESNVLKEEGSEAGKGNDSEIKKK